MKRLLADDLTVSYVPEPEQRRWRLLARTRVRMGRQKTALYSLLEGVLEEGRIKLSCVVSDLLGGSGRRILRALVEGESDPERLAAQADERAKATPEQLRQALRGSLHATHRLTLGMFLDQIELLERQMTDLEKELSRAMAAQEEAILRVAGLPGVRSQLGTAGDRRGGAAGPPGRQESAGVSHNNRSPKGNRSMRCLLIQCAWAAVRTKGSYFQDVFRRLVPRRGVKKPIWAIGHRLLKLLWKVLHQGVCYEEKGPRAGNQQALQRRKRYLLRELRRLGNQVQITGPAPTPAQ